MTTEWKIEKRVANTDEWRVVGHATSQEEATNMAMDVEGGRSTGVRICQTDTPDRDPIIVAGV